MVATLPDGPVVLALDGPGVLDWELAVHRLATAWGRRGRPVRLQSMAHAFVPWEELILRTEAGGLANDPDFAKLPSGDLADLVVVPAPRVDRSCHWVVYGPGAALVKHDVLWYVDLPKRFAEQAVLTRGAVNLGQPEDRGPGTARRLFYVDWPLLDRHRDGIANRIDRWVDLHDGVRPTSIDGGALRGTLAHLAQGPLRTQPTFNTAPWGGHWGQDVLGFNRHAPSTALGYELIAPESGVLLGDDPSVTVEVPFSLLVALHSQDLLGSDICATFGTSFPIRFDYLDTVGGGHLSVHTHPQSGYMRKTFGWPYTQHETYYVVAGGEGSKIFLGLRADADLDAFSRDAHDADEKGRAFDIEQYVQTFPAVPGSLFMVPAGTPHGSGSGNVILEVSATPYLYSLRFYDWLRHDSSGRQRPVHVDHAFGNLDSSRAGDRVRQDLVQQPRLVKTGPGWHEERLGRLPDCFFEVRRVVLGGDVSVPDDTAGRFHVLNLVDGAGVELETNTGRHHVLHRWETLLVPASSGPYRLHNIGGEQARLVKSLVV